MTNILEVHAVADPGISKNERAKILESMIGAAHRALISRGSGGGRHQEGGQFFKYELLRRLLREFLA